MIKSIVLLSSIILLNLWLAAPANGQHTFKVGYAEVNITPTTPQRLSGYAGVRYSEGLRDSLHHKVVVMDDGTTQFYLVSSELTSVGPDTYDVMAAKLSERFGIKREQFWWTMTHTHSAPRIVLTSENRINPDYSDFVGQQLIEAIERARKQMVPAKMGIGWGFSRANINRRARLVDNTTFLGENPDGPVDRKIGLIKIEDLNGKPLVLLANYPIHATVLSSKDARISGDVPGEVARYVKEQTGAPLFFINGASGNLAPRFSVSINKEGLKDRELRQFQKLLGEPIIEASNKIAVTMDQINLKLSSITVELPKGKRPNSPEPAYFKDYAGKTSMGDSVIRFPVGFLNINDDVAIWSAPCELFCEVANEIRSESPFLYTFYWGLTNGSMLYLCTDEELKMGGYEPNTTWFAPGSAGRLSSEVSAHLDALSRKF